MPGLAQANLNRAASDEVAYMAGLRGQLEDAQQIAEQQLLSLAESRPQAILDYLLTDLSVGNDRVKASEISAAKVEDERWIKLELSLGVSEVQETGNGPGPVSSPSTDETTADGLPANVASEVPVVEGATE